MKTKMSFVKGGRGYKKPHHWNMASFLTRRQRLALQTVDDGSSQGNEAQFKPVQESTPDTEISPCEQGNPSSNRSSRGNETHLSHPTQLQKPNAATIPQPVLKDAFTLGPETANPKFAEQPSLVSPDRSAIDKRRDPTAAAEEAPVPNSQLPVRPCL